MSSYLKEMNEEERKNWEEKMSEPLKPKKLTREEIEELKKQGRI
ncbi:tRNA (adenine(58)-N(1))-methyltransferase non-catalytic subunit TRM6 [Clostridium sp. E02]|nr:tRNA (adenine(58)-N(1))-methyltransferase non-catalytic subunit TRM6 [Clostridium sp. E02]